MDSTTQTPHAGTPHTEPTSSQVRRWRRYLAEERMEAQTYRNLAAGRPEGPQRDIMLELAEAEGRHEQYWLDRLGRHAEPAPTPPFPSRMVAALAGKFGSVFVLALAQRSEQRTAYDSDVDATEQMAADEHIHGEVVRSLAAESRAQMAGSFRAAVFGANDGLVSNLALILGVAATGMEPTLVLATGAAGLLAGALSMGAGEWISISSQRELLDASRPDPKANRSVSALDVDSNELALLFRARGESPEDASAHAHKVFSTLGEGDSVDTGSVPLRATLGEGNTGASASIGTPWQACISSFCFFAVGALIPLVPYILGLTGLIAAGASLALVGVALLLTGTMVGLLSGRAAWRSALRQLAIGYGAAGITWILGSLFGTTVG